MARFSLMAKMGLDTTQFSSRLKSVRARMANFAQSIKTKLGLAVGAVGLTKLARDAIETGSKISDLAVQLKLTAEEVQVFQFAAREAGLQLRDMENALSKVMRRTEEAAMGNKTYAKALKQLGLDAQEIVKLPVAERFQQIAEAVAEADGSTRSIANAAMILGRRSGPRLTEVLLKLGNEGFGSVAREARDAGQVMSDETAQAMDTLSDRGAFLQRSLVNMAAAVVARVIPVMGVLRAALALAQSQTAKLILNIGELTRVLLRLTGAAITPATNALKTMSLAFEAAMQRATGQGQKAVQTLEEIKAAAKATKDAAMGMGDAMSAAADTPQQVLDMREMLEQELVSATENFEAAMRRLREGEMTKLGTAADDLEDTMQRMPAASDEMADDTESVADEAERAAKAEEKRLKADEKIGRELKEQSALIREAESVARRAAAGTLFGTEGRGEFALGGRRVAELRERATRAAEAGRGEEIFENLRRATELERKRAQALERGVRRARLEEQINEALEAAAAAMEPGRAVGLEPGGFRLERLTEGFRAELGPGSSFAKLTEEQIDKASELLDRMDPDERARVLGDALSQPLSDIGILLQTLAQQGQEQQDRRGPAEGAPTAGAVGEIGTQMSAIEGIDRLASLQEANNKTLDQVLETVRGYFTNQ